MLPGLSLCIGHYLTMLPSMGSACSKTTLWNLEWHEHIRDPHEQNGSTSHPLQDSYRNLSLTLTKPSASTPG